MWVVVLYSLLRGVYCDNLFMSADKGLYSINEVNKTVTMEMNLSIPFHSWDYHYTKEYLYYTNGSIFRFSSSEEEPISIVTYPPDVFVTNLAVDWIHDKIYWTIGLETHIYVSYLDGQQQISFITSQQLQELNYELKPTYSDFILIDPYEGLLFFLQYFKRESNRKNSIIRSDLQGKGLVAYFNTQLRTAESLALEMREKRILFAGTQTLQKHGFLCSVDYNGENLVTHYKSPMTFISPVYVSAGNIYMVIRELGVNSGSAFIYKINLTSHVVSLEMENLNFKTIFIIKSLLWENQLTSSEFNFSRCDSKVCSYQCTAFPTAGPTCVCPPGEKITPSGRNCQDDGVKLLISNQSPQLYKYGIIEVLPLKAPRQFFAYHYQKDFIFFYSYPNNTIYRSTLSRGDSIAKIAENIEPLCAIEVDWVYDKLYWLDEDGIQLSTLNGDMQHRLRLRRSRDYNSGTTSTCDIEVDPYEKYLFILQNGIIHRSNLQLNYTIALTKPSRHKVTSFTIDIKQRKVFMSATDTGLAEDGYLASVSYDFSDMFIYPRKLGNIIDRMAIFDNILYVICTDVSTTYFYWSELTATENQNFEKLFDADAPITDLVVYHPRAQMSPEDQACQDLSCSHMCEIVQGGNGKEVKCKCPRPLELDKDDKTCSLNKEVDPGENENSKTHQHHPQPQLETNTYDGQFWLFIALGITGVVCTFLTLCFCLWKNHGFTWGRHRWEYRNNWWRRPETQREDNHFTSKIS